MKDLENVNKSVLNENFASSFEKLGIAYAKQVLSSIEKSAFLVIRKENGIIRDLSDFTLEDYTRYSEIIKKYCSDFITGLEKKLPIKINIEV